MNDINNKQIFKMTNTFNDEESISNDEPNIYEHDTNDNINFNNSHINIDGVFNRININRNTGIISHQRPSLFVSCIMYNCLEFLLLVIFFIPFYDIYYGFSDESCLKFNPSSKIKISLGTFLKIDLIYNCVL